MQAEIRLKQILDDAGMATKGRIDKIAGATGLARDTVRKFLQNKTGVFSTDTIGKICGWLEESGMGGELPGKLFAVTPPRMIEAIREPGTVSMLVGVYQGRGRPGFARGSIARDDFAVAARLVELLSRPSRRAVRFTYVHVPTHMSFDGHKLDRSVLERDQQEAKRTYDGVRHNAKSGSTVLIGSQRANYAVECFVADLVKAKPFSPKNSPAPIYLKYHEPERSSSCFGGNVAPVPDGKSAPAGIYFRHRGETNWEKFESHPRHRGAGMVIVRRDPGLGRVELAVFGLSGFATAAMGKIYCQMPDRFPPQTRARGGAEVGVYICGFRIAGMKSDEQNVDTVTLGPPEIVRLDLPPARR